MIEIQSILHKLDDSKSYEDQLLLLSKTFGVSIEVISEDRTGLRDITTHTTHLLEQLRKIGFCKSSSGNFC